MRCRLFVKGLTDGKPREATCGPEALPTLVFTDGACEGPVHRLGGS